MLCVCLYLRIERVSERIRAYQGVLGYYPSKFRSHMTARRGLAGFVILTAKPVLAFSPLFSVRGKNIFVFLFFAVLASPH